MNDADRKAFQEIEPVIIAVTAFFVWLRRPDWPVSSCVQKAKEFTNLAKEP